MFSFAIMQNADKIDEFFFFISFSLRIGNLLFILKPRFKTTIAIKLDTNNNENGNGKQLRRIRRTTNLLALHKN